MPMTGTPSATDPGPLDERIVPYRAWNRVRNVGDAITPYLLRHYFGVSPVQASPADTHVLAVGSVLHFANRHSLVWGSGVLRPASPAGPIHPQNLRALGGPPPGGPPTRRPGRASRARPGRGSARPARRRPAGSGRRR
ncbi:MAG: hypothetical protein ACT4P0_07875, partial [Panacagrimonas sp.]